MEPQIWLPAAAALGGALIGSIAPVVVGLLNAHSEARRERLRLAVQLAIEEHQQMMELARHRVSTGRATDIPPLSAMLGYHAQLLEQLACILEVSGGLIVIAAMQSHLTYRDVPWDAHRDALASP